MVEVRWDKDAGWHNASVRAYGPLQLDPAALGVSEAAIAQFALRVPEGFVAQLAENRAGFPLGVDLILTAPGRVAALPRSTTVTEA